MTKDTIRDLSISIYKAAYDSPLVVSHYRNYPRTDLVHRHVDFYEISLIITGRALHESGSERISLHAGDVIFLRPGTVHRYSGTKDFENYNLLFSPDLLAETPEIIAGIPHLPLLINSNSTETPVMHVSERYHSEIIRLSEAVISELTIQRPGWKSAVRILFLRILLALFRNMSSPSEAKNSTNVFNISKTIEFLEQNYNKKLSLGQLARHSKMSISSFRHHFKSQTGCSPINYLINFRLKKALFILIYNFNVRDVAIETGFATSEYFTNQFKKKLGMSPRDFSNNYKSGKLVFSEILDRL